MILSNPVQGVDGFCLNTSVVTCSGKYRFLTCNFSLSLSFFSVQAGTATKDKDGSIWQALQKGPTFCQPTLNVGKSLDWWPARGLLLFPLLINMPAHKRTTSHNYRALTFSEQYDKSANVSQAVLPLPQDTPSPNCT